MANEKISEQPAVVTPNLAHLFVSEVAGVSNNKYTRAQVLNIGIDTQAYSAVLDTVSANNAVVTFANTGLKIKDTDASHTVTLSIGSDISADRTLTINTGDADRSITLTGNATFGDDFDQPVKTTSSVVHDNLTLSATNALLAGSDRAITLLNDVTSNTITIGGTGSTTSIYNLAVTGSTFIATVTTVEIEDKKIALGKGGSTAGLTAAGISLLGDADAEVGYIQTGAADNTIFELNAPGNAFILTLDVNATKTVTVAGNLNIEGDSAINQDVTTDADVVFNKVTTPTYASTGAMAINPTDDLTINQNSVAVITSVETNAKVNTIYLDNGNLGIATTTPGFNTGGEGTTNANYFSIRGASTTPGIVELGAATNSNGSRVGRIQFTNLNNGSRTVFTAESTWVAGIRSEVVTSDSNADDDSGGTLVFATKAEAGSVTDRMTLNSDGGLTIGSPTGGSKGAGTLNATGVYDDNVLLTDYVFEKAYLGTPIEARHKKYKMLTLDQEIDFTKKHYHLSTIKGRNEWGKKGKPSTGESISQLTQTVETSFLYLADHQQEIRDLKKEIVDLKEAMSQ